ncbi:hypothetical protein C2G38_2182064 [Gigaspora rosea]|uniref:SWIM-type domain-containing protein n=1 Tax=Gigaspora rosea TaxID=44941 RepID=A0A397VAC2_9GLOM|nr:hypothetical protein C2G38_2182064 [Gigaspora rosea]
MEASNVMDNMFEVCHNQFCTTIPRAYLPPEETFPIEVQDKPTELVIAINFSWESLLEILKPVLPMNYTYLIQSFDDLPPFQTEENFEIPNFKLDAFVNVNNVEKAQRRQLLLSHPVEINIEFMHNHVINSASSLSFRHVNNKVCEKFINLFRDGHSLASALHVFEDELCLNITNEQELLEILANQAYNPGYDYVAKLFQQYRDNVLGGRNEKSIFECLDSIILEYNNSGKGRVVLQEYNSNSGNAFILCIVTNLMARIHKKIPQAQEICYIDASVSFDPLNISITLLYTSCAAGALPLGLFLTSNEQEITIEKALTLLKTILPPNAFYGQGPQARPLIFWRWIYDSKHQIEKEDRMYIMENMKKILYSLSNSEMETHYEDFKQKYYNKYSQLKRHVELLWVHRQFWALSFRAKLPLYDNEYLVPSTNENSNTNYIVNSEIGICSCPVGMSDAPCKHQEAVVSKFHISIFNFIPSLTPNDCAIYTYIALGYINLNQDRLFYVSLHARPMLQNQEILYTGNKPEVLDKECDKIIETNNSNFILFLEEIRSDYQNADESLRTALDKFKDRYNSAKSKSVSRLSSFLYDINRNMDPMAHIKSGAHIRVQVESIKRRNIKQKPVIENKENKNLDPHIYSCRPNPKLL